MLIVLQADCLKIFISRTSSSPSVLHADITPSIDQDGSPAASRLQQIASSHRLRILGFALVGSAVITALTTEHIVHRIELTAAAGPLAPAPAPPTAPPAVHHKRHFFSNPLHGLASWYGSVWNGRTTASGETYDDSQMTAAHKSLPLGTLVRVTNLNSMRSVVVRINDRGAMAPNRVIDLSSAAAREIGMMDQGLTRVELKILGKL